MSHDSESRQWRDHGECITVADDVVLVAETEEDMHYMLERAYVYSQTHRFKFNAGKCKVMTNLRGGKWRLGKEEIKQVDDFTYLGVCFGRRAGWKAMEDKLAARVRDRIGKTLTLRKMHGLEVSLCVQVWDSIGEPAMQYGAEVWGTRVPKILEKLRKELGRALINAPASTNCEVIQGELGWRPIKANWDIARLMYWHRLCWGRNTLAKWVFKERKKTANRKDKDNWCVGTLLLLQELKLDNFWKYGFLGTREKWRDLVRGRVRKREEDAWRRRVASRPRLGTYRKIKRSLELEEYLDVLEGQRKRNIVETNLRWSRGGEGR